MTAICAKIISIVLLTLGSTQAAPSSGYDLWNNPCSNHPIRHIRSTAEKELNYFINTLNKTMLEELKPLYPKDLKKVKGNCPRLRKLIRPIERASNLITAHQNIYKSLFEFSVYLDKLKDMPIRTHTQFNLDERKAIYEKTKHTLRLTICEFHDTMIKDFEMPNTFFEKVPKVNTRCLPKHADLSRVQMLDIQFFKKLKKFIKQGKSILKRKKNNSKSDKMREGHKKRTKS